MQGENKVQPSFCEIDSVQILCPDRAKGAITLEFGIPPELKKEAAQRADAGKEKIALEYTLKEGSIYQMAFKFNVKYDIVYGLKFCTIIRKGKVIVAKDE